MSTLESIILGYGIYLMTSYIIESISLFMKSANRFVIGTVGMLLSLVALGIWRFILPENSTMFYVVAGLLVLNLLISMANMIFSMISCNPRQGI